jgi:hypothetical protein
MIHDKKGAAPHDFAPTPRTPRIRPTATPLAIAAPWV